ncbi:hypothetical protein MA16_Dca018335 [Dendrobium catenatum]|uniref:Uncharacterized protein n=1 Tax=Dendrobium catenatum TaxID=906689 RepID=A0A2I0VWQ2_9ASPA|nr:hypothetical protein MA16_Dca018335 [Dendrobium catenatum]
MLFALFCTPISNDLNPLRGHGRTVSYGAIKAADYSGGVGKVAAYFAGGSGIDVSWNIAGADVVRIVDVLYRVHDDALGAGYDVFALLFGHHFVLLRIV